MYDFSYEEAGFQSFTLVRQAWIAINKVCEDELAKLDLSPEMVVVLWLCRDYQGTLIPAEISRMMLRENQSVAGLLNRMEQKGLIKRIPKRKGKPYTDVTMTPKGAELCGPAVDKYKAAIDDLTSDLSPVQHEQLQKAARILRDKALKKLRIEQIDKGPTPVKLQ